jgi:hypothetical protein
VSEYADYDDMLEDIEGYCLRCQESIIIEEAAPVWTRKGQPATRGICPSCGGSVFRMGKTEAHDLDQRPDAIDVAGEGKRNLPRLERDTVYIMFAPEDEATALQLADDLNKVGLAVWTHDYDDADVNWASRVHPALKECRQMILVLSDAALGRDGVTTGWQFFKQERKPIIIAQIAETAPPDLIRRSPRFDFRTEYKRSFRQMMQALA